MKCVTSAPFLFLNNAHHVASRPKILPSEILNSGHTGLLLSHYAQYFQHSGCSINIHYGKREKQPASQPVSVDGGAFPAVSLACAVLFAVRAFLPQSGQSIFHLPFQASSLTSVRCSLISFVLQSILLIPLAEYLLHCTLSYSLASVISHHFVETT